MANVVLVADMVRGFCEEGHNLYVGPTNREIIPRIQKLLREEKAKGSHIIFLCDTHDPNDLEFKMFPVHCIRGTEEANVIEELAGYDGEIVPKRRYNALFDTDLAERLAELNPAKVIVCGVCTDICVMYTAADLRARDYDVEIHRDCVATFDPQAHENALDHMEKILGVRLVG